jgi:hypothetical protein
MRSHPRAGHKYVEIRTDIFRQMQESAIRRNESDEPVTPVRRK